MTDSASLTNPDSTTNKDIIQRALSELMTTGSVDGLRPLFSDDFVHHRPDATFSTKDEWLAAVQAALIPLAGMQVEVRHLLGDGGHVVLHTRRWLPDGPEIAVIEIWRIEDGLISEAWEIIEPVARAAANLTWWEPAGP
ncbi:nuclear transport factor 2 family protein [Actinomadura sp. WMMA1423]|uniref:nuclear transport factor 2 family protein n=1 Tax=Actinomadura sp. WMMA1423 TaxID=2591108 RepID=UPI001146B725|nr:nuclear transport factor 2 family protein [Actinomadura sp. WMMA1423]